MRGELQAALLFPEPRQTLAAQADRARFGMLVFLFSKTMFFVALIGAYLVLRRASTWPPPGVPRFTLELALPNTLVLVASALASLLALRAARRGDGRFLVRGLAAALLLGSVFLTVQVFEWTGLHRRGLAFGLAYSSCYYVLTGFHALYVAIGLWVFAMLFRRARAGRYGPSSHLGVELGSLYWHFVGLVWVLLFLAIYVLPRTGT